MTSTLTPGSRQDLPARSGPDRRVRWVVGGGLTVVVIAAVVLRFWTRSPLWLDEAQSVAIARLPLSGAGTTVWDGLKQDGSPPLYYLLLHGWIRAFGTGSFAVRSLSGVLSLASVPLLWRLARYFGTRRATLAAVLFFASSPFAVRFATETRMYSLLVLLALVGGLALRRVLVLGPSALSVLVLAVDSAALALTHYWSFYLLLVVGAALIVGAVRSNGPERRRYAWALVGEFAGAVLFAPWLPEFLYQLKHTGTPWGEPAGLSVVVHAFAEWAGGPTAAGRGLFLVLGVLLAFAVFGTAVDGRRVLLDLRGHEPGRLLLGLSVSVLVVAVAAGHLVGTAWADRYTATAFVPFLIVAGLGVQALASPRVATGFVAVACVLGLAASAPDVTTNRTSAGTVGRLVDAQARPGDIVLSCPDQLGPALSREVRAGIPVLGVPTLESAARVDWVDYRARQERANPAAIAAAAVARVGPNGTVFFAVANSYRTYETLCPAVQASLAALRPVNRTLYPDSGKTLEHEGLIAYAPSPRRG